MKRFYNKVYTYINNLNFRDKILLTFLFISLIPLCILGTFSFASTRSLLLKQQTNTLKTTLVQTEQTLDKQFSLYNKIIRSLCFNQQLITISHTDFTSDYDKYEQLNFIDSLFVMTKNLAPGIDSITFYTKANLANHGNTVLSIEEAKKEKWYNVVSPLDTTWYYTEDHIYCIKPVLSTKFRSQKTDYIVMRINTNTLMGTLQSMEENRVSAAITDARNHIILLNDKQNIPAKTLKTMANSTKDILKQSNYISMKADIPDTEWHLMIYSSYQDIVSSTFVYSAIVLLIILFCFAAVLITSRLFSKKIVYRIQLLKENMKEVENGKLEVHVTSNSNDEIGELIHGFSNMVTKIDRLIEENYVATIAQKEYELKALQAQINPHFLYNSLSLINWRALRLHATEISEMAQLLSSFYRTTLNKGNNLTTVSEEILNVKSYLQIQLIMHSHEFEVEYQIAENTAHYSMPNLMLQPLVENAILHGLEKQETSGKIVLSCIKKEDYLLFTVKDNGVGIPEELLPTILESKSKGYGLRNVNQRAKLLYGDDYGLSVESTVGVGTTLKLKIPLKED